MFMFIKIMTAQYGNSLKCTNVMASPWIMKIQLFHGIYTEIPKLR